MKSDIVIKQKYLSPKGMLVMLAATSMFPVLSTDLYLPALPQMMQALGTSSALVNLTLSLFFIFFAIGLLIWGPLSDKYGRKPILVIGLIIYVAASLCCALSQTIHQLILSRVFQAIGGGAATAVATAIVKDLYRGREREKVLSIVYALVVISPIIAPMLGAILLKIASWRFVFWVLCGVGVLVILASILLEETLQTPYTGSFFKVLGRLGVVLKNPGFSSLLFTFSLTPMVMMAFIASSSYIYIQGFGSSEQSFSLYFALNAVFVMIGPLIYLKISNRFQSQTVIFVCFLMLAASGVLVILFGHAHPVLFALSVIPATTSGSLMRPPTANLMLGQQDQDSGSASSLIHFAGFVMGSLGIVLISGNWKDLIVTLGTLQLVIGILSTLLWYWLKNRNFIRFKS